MGVKTLYITPGSPWENGYIESFNGKLRNELLNGEIFDTLLEAKVLIERWRVHYNTVRPHSSLGYRPPAPEDSALAAGFRGCAPPPADQCCGRTITNIEYGPIHGGQVRVTANALSASACSATDADLLNTLLRRRPPI